MARGNPHPNTSGLRPPFEKGNCANPNGRPPTKRIAENLQYVLGKKKTKKFLNISGAEVDFWENAILTMSFQDLKTLSGGKVKGEIDATVATEVPIYVVNTARAILFDISVGKTTTIDRLRERQFGKAVQKVELTGKDGTPFNPEPLTIEVIDNRDKVMSNAEDTDNESIQ
jgi:hypothetical protein